MEHEVFEHRDFRERSTKKPKSGRKRWSHYQGRSRMHYWDRHRNNVADALRYGAVDVRVVPVCEHWPGKTGAPYYESIWPDRTNVRQYQTRHQQHTAPKTPVRMCTPNMTWLPAIHPRLALANLDWVENFSDQRLPHGARDHVLDREQIEHVIHLVAPGDRTLVKQRGGYRNHPGGHSVLRDFRATTYSPHVYDAGPIIVSAPGRSVTHTLFDVPPWNACDYLAFRDLMDRVAEALHASLVNHRTVLHCRDGANWSVCGVVAWALRYRDAWPLDRVRAYIQTQKTTVGERWGTLTQAKVNRWLHQYARERVTGGS